MDNLRTIVAAFFVVCLIHSHFVAADEKCTYNTLIANFNRKAHENGQRFYYECDEQIGYYIGKMCAQGEVFDVKKLSCVKESSIIDLLQSARLTRAQSKLCQGMEDGERIVNYKEKCQSFFICEGGVPHERSCPTGFLFNSKTRNCDWPSNVDCVSSTEEVPTSSTRMTSTTECSKRPTAPPTPRWDDVCVEGVLEDDCDSATEPTPPNPPTPTQPRPPHTHETPTGPPPTPPKRPTPPTPPKRPTPPTPPNPPTPTQPRPPHTPETPTGPPPTAPTGPPPTPPTGPPPTPPNPWPPNCPPTTPCPCTCEPETTNWPIETPETTVNHWPTGLPSVTWNPPITNPGCPPWGCVTLSSTIIHAPPTPSTPAPRTPPNDCPPGGCVEGKPEATQGIPEAGPPLPTPSTPWPPTYDCPSGTCMQGKPESHRP